MSACVDCGKAISRRATRCRSCNGTHIARTEIAVSALRKRMQDPDVQAQLREARSRPDVRKRMSESQRARRLAHIHVDYRDLYMDLQYYGTATERFNAIRLQMKKDGVAA